MASVNKVILVGNAGRDPEIRHTPSGAAVATFSIATNEVRTNKEGQREERTEWHRIVAFGKLAEICGQYITKGKQVYLEGRLQTKSWEDRDGNKRATTEIIASNMVLLGRPGEAPAQDFTPQVPDTPDMLTNELNSQEDDIPF
jgi:single-strand DNA-binding protein